MGAHGADHSVEVSRTRRIWTVVAMCLVLLPIIAPITGITVAGPDIARATGATQVELTWIFDSYTLGLAVALLPAGALADRFGRRGVMLLGLALYILFSVGPLITDDPNLLILSRLLTGLAAGIAMPSTLSIITGIFPPGGRERMVGLWAGFTVINAAWGIVAFGVMTEMFDWRAVFWLALGLGVFGFLIGLTVPTSGADDPPPLDVPGTLASITGVGAVVFALIEAPHRGWASPFVLLILGAGFAMLALFAVIELRAKHPLLDVRLFTIRAVGASSLALLAQFVILFGAFYLTVLYLQFARGFSPVEAGLMCSFMVVTILPTTILVSAKWGLRRLYSVGSVFSAASLGVMLFAGVDAGYWVPVVCMLLIGTGVGISTGPATSAVVDNVSEDKQGVASAVNHTTREVGTALGIAFFGSMMSSGFLREIEGPTEGLPEPAREVSRESVVGALEVAKQLPGPVGEQLARDAQEAFVAGVHQAAIAGMVLMAVVSIFIIIWSPKRERVPIVGDLPGPPAEGRAVEGRICATVGAPIGRAAVTLTDLVGTQVATTRTDHDGRYRLSVSNPGTYLVVCMADPLPPHASVITVGDSVRHDVTLTGAATLRGRVRMGNGTAPGTVVTLIDEAGDVTASTTAWAGGGFRFEDLRGGHYTLVAAAANPIAVQVDLPAGREVEQDLDLPISGRLRGVVRSAVTGNPIAEALTTLHDMSGDEVAWLVTGPDGVYEFDVPEGEYTVRAAGFAPGETIAQVETGTRFETDLRLDPPTNGFVRQDPGGTSLG